MNTPPSRRRGRRAGALARRGGALVAASVILTAGGVAGAVALQPGRDDRSAAIAGAIDPSVPKNVILLVGDGMAESEITAARGYNGLGSRLAMDALPFRGVATNHMVSAADNDRFDFLTDSAAGATGFATGRKTVLNRLSQGPTTDLAQPGSNDGWTTALEKARALGKRTGNITTGPLTDATPAAQVAHLSNRSCQGPADARRLCPQETKHAGGLGSIAEQAVDHEVDVLMGGGRSVFDQRLDGPAGDGSGAPTALEYATAQGGYRLVETAAQLAAVDSVADAPLLGLFAGGGMATEFGGAQAAPAPGNRPTPSGRCDEELRRRDHPEQPSLAAMTRKAIELLDGERGFFLQVEGAQIDDEAHESRPCGVLGETLAFDDAVAVALEYQRTHSDTLVVVTADHGHAGQILAYYPPILVPTGYFQTIETRGGDELVLAYSSSGGREGQSPDPVPGYQNHSGTAVPVMAVGPQAANVSGVQDLTDLHPLLSFELQPSQLPRDTQTVTVPVPGPVTTVTTPGPTRTVTRARRLSVGAAAPPALARDAARRAGVPVALLSSRRARATVRLLHGRRTLARSTLTLGADRGRAVTLRPGRRLARLRARALLRVRVDVRAGGERRHAIRTLRLR